MTTTFLLNADELDATFIERIQTAFPHRQIEISVTEADETDSLMADPERRKRLLRAVEDVAHGREIVVPEQSLFQ